VKYLTDDDYKLTGSKTEYQFARIFFSQFFTNAPPITKGSVLKECKDGMYKVFEPDGKTEVTCRFSDTWIKRNFKAGTIISRVRTI